MPLTTEQSKLYLASKKNDTRYPYVEVEVPVPEKKQKYKRYQHEKRAKHPGAKRVQTPHIMVTKWDVENANTRNKKVGRNRDRAYKYGNWNDNRTDTVIEDDVNRKQHSNTEQRRRAVAKENAARASLSEYAALLFPVYSLEDTTGWPVWAWNSYQAHEEIELAEMAAVRAKAWHDLLNSPEQIAINAANDEHNARQTGLIEGDRVYDIDLDTDEETDYETDEDM
jgi:hypothetical protein